MQNLPEKSNKPSANVTEIIKKGQEVYSNLKSSLEPEHNGKYVAIEVDSQKYFIGETRNEAIEEARKEFPNKIVFVKRIGQVEKISRHLSVLNQKYAGIL